MTNKTTEKLFTEEFLDNLNFLINHFNIEEAYREIINDYTDEELCEELFEKFEDLFAEVKQQIDDYYNTDFTEVKKRNEIIKLIKEKLKLYEK